DADPAERRAVIAARDVQLVDEHQQNVELADDAEPQRHAAQPAGELFAHIALELKRGDELAQAARRNAGAMERAHVALLESVADAREAVETAFEQLRSRKSVGHDDEGRPQTS